MTFPDLMKKSLTTRPIVRQEVSELAKLGPPPDSEADEGLIATYERLIERISKPVTNEEARVLVRLFGPDECYGLAWTLLHLIESAPAWPLEECLEGSSNEWIQRLKLRAERGTRNKG